MQEIVVATFCDRCYQTDKTKVEATDEVEVTVGEQKARLDLCQRCNQVLLDPLRALLKAREAAQRALDKSTSTTTREPRARRPRSGPLARCGKCDAHVEVRHRSTHARTRHDGATPEDLTWYFDDLTEVWPCSCGLPFPTEHSRNTHSRRASHPLPDDTGPRASPAAS